MNFKIVSDSSSNIFTLPGVDYATVPLKIVAGDREWVDNAELDLEEMVDTLKTHKGPSGSSCPNVQEWLDAFQGGKNILAMTISSKLSGSYAAAKHAAAEYMEENPGTNVVVLDSLATGPEMGLLMEKFRELMEAGKDFAESCRQLVEYHAHTHTMFYLESLSNLARNGRVSKAVATIAGVLGIRVVGEAQNGEIAPVHKPRGQKKATETIVKMMEERGLTAAKKVRIDHCFALENANMLKEALEKHFPGIQVILGQTAGLCSFYAEVGGLIIGMEGNRNPYKC